MSFLAPAALLLSLLALPIILLYMLRLRRREVRVSSVYLWQKMVRDREANAPWQKLRRNLLLLLQLLILALLVLALAQPYLVRSGVVDGSVVLLLDGSASMLATDSAPDRWAQAQVQAAQLIDELGGGNQMTLILVGQTPQILAAATTDKGVLREAVNTAVAQPAPANWPAAFALASGAAQGFSQAQILLISDGGIPPDLPNPSAELRYLPIGQSASNLAISALAGRPIPNEADETGATDETPYQLLATVSNWGEFDQTTRLDLLLDGQLHDVQELVVPAGGSQNVVWDVTVPLTQTVIAEALITPRTADHLAADNRALTVLNSDQKTTVAIIGQNNLFLERVLDILPHLQTVSPDQGADLTIFNGVPVPNPPPAGDILLINPVPEQDPAFLTVGDVLTDTAAIRLEASPILQFVEWRGLNIAEMREVSAPNWQNTQTLVEAPGGPLLLVGEQNGHRRAVLSFNLNQSDLPLRIAFPILMANLTSWLSPGVPFVVPENMSPGEVVTLIPQPQTTAVQITLPDGTTWESPLQEQELLFSDTQQLGLYQVALRQGETWQPAGAFAINLFAPLEANIQPRAELQLGAQTIGNANQDPTPSQWPLWPYLAAFALLVLLIEWWIYQQGTRLPSPPQGIGQWVATHWQKIRRQSWS
jgi:Ca-activated chloride channel homolog